MDQLAGIVERERELSVATPESFDALRLASLQAVGILRRADRPDSQATSAPRSPRWRRAAGVVDDL